MKYHFLVHKEENGFWAECIELSGCLTQAETAEELKSDCFEALNLYLEEPQSSHIVFPLPQDITTCSKNILEIPVEPEIALAVLLRHNRSILNLTQKQVSEKLGMKNVYSYQRLEKKSNPSLQMIKKITSIFPAIKLEMLF